MAKKVPICVRGLLGLTVLVALAGCHFEDTWSGSASQPPTGSNPPIGGNPPPPPEPDPDDNLPRPDVGNATLAWVPPLENTDGSSLQDLSGYRIHYGTQSGNYEFIITIHNAGVTRYVVEDLQPGTYYFAVTAVSANGVESDLSDEATKTI